MLRNSDGVVLMMLIKYVGILESNEVEVLAILESLRVFLSNYHVKLVMESNSVDVISGSSSKIPNEIKSLCSLIGDGFNF